MSHCAWDATDAARIGNPAGDRRDVEHFMQPRAAQSSFSLEAAAAGAGLAFSMPAPSSWLLVFS